MLRRLATRVPKASLFESTRRSFFSPYRGFDYFTNSLMRDMEQEFRRDFGPRSFFGHNSPYYSEPEYQRSAQSTYEKRTITTKDDGRVVVKTVRKAPGQPWQTKVEEYTDEGKLSQAKRPEALEGQSAQNSEQTQQQMVGQASSETEKNVEKKQAGKEHSEQSITRHQDHKILDEFDRDFKQLSSSFNRGFDGFFGRSAFDDFWGVRPSWTRNWFDSDSMFFDPENTTYRLKTVVNDNGNVTVKTASKNPGGEWQTSVKQYNNQGKAVEGSQKQEALSEGGQKQGALSEGSKGEQLNEKKASEDVSKEQTQSQ